MTPLRFALSTLFAVFGSVSAFSAATEAGNPLQDAARPRGEKMDRNWKQYHNTTLGYCVSYPSRWVKEDAFEGSGLFVQTGVHRYSRPTGEIDIGPLDIPGPEDARLRRADMSGEGLEQDLQEHLAGLQKFVRAERVRVIARQTLKVQGFQALYAKSSYYDPLERASWVQEVVFVAREGQVYRLELQCPPDQLERFEPVFAYLVNTFNFECK